MDKLTLIALLTFFACVTASTTGAPLKEEGPNFNDVKIFLAIPIFASGVLMCFFGLKLIKVVIFLSGFIPGTLITFSIITAATANALIGLLVGLVVGIICGLIALCCMKVAIFLTGFSAGSMIVFGIASLIFHTEPDNTAVGIVTFIVGICAGIATLWLWEKAIIILTSFIGANEIITAALFVFETNVDMEHFTTGKMLIYLAAFAVLFIAGMFYQNKTKPEGANKQDAGAVYVNVPQQGYPAHHQ